jgi:hypothetical protein
MILNLLICMVPVTIVTGVALAMSFGETGHRDGYEEGHLSSSQQDSGCSSLFYWLLVQFCFDLVFACFLCLLLQPLSLHDTVGFIGCCGSLRLCLGAIGFHILYLYGLKRDLCNEFLLIWSTILTWLGVAVIVLVSCYLGMMLGFSARPSLQAAGPKKSNLWTP